MLLLRESGMTQPAIAEAMGVSLSTVNRAHMAYDHDGVKALRPKPNDGRKHENMTVAEHFRDGTAGSSPRRLRHLDCNQPRDGTLLEPAKVYLSVAGGRPSVAGV